MCQGFGMIVSKDLQGYFTLPDQNGNMSHSEILRALDWKENTHVQLRRFVRVQCPDWTIGSFEFDEKQTLPGWAEESQKQIKELVNKALKKCTSAWAEYEKGRAPAWAKYEKVRDAAQAEYEKVRAPAWAEYEKVRDAALAKYKKVRDAAWVGFRKSLLKIPGFVE